MAASSSTSSANEIQEAVSAQSNLVNNLKLGSSSVVKLMTSDQQIIEVEAEAAEQCEAIKHLMEDGCADSVIPVPNVDSETLTMVAEWCKRHVAGEKAVEEADLKKWEDDFVDRDEAVLYHLIMAANYLAVKGLLDRVAQKVADMIKGKHPDEIRKIFNIKNDFEPEEYEKIISDNSWAFQ